MLAKTCPILSNAPVSLATPGAGPDDGFMADSMDSMDSMDELRALLRRHGQDANTLTPIPRVEIRVGLTTTGPLPTMFPPMVCFVLQGAKRMMVGEKSLIYRGHSYLVVSVDLPATGQVVEATADQPYIAIGLMLDPAVIAALLIDMPVDLRATPPAAVSKEPAGAGFGISPLTPDLIDPLLRMMRLLDQPRDIPILAPLVERELLYRVMLGPQGAMLRDVGLADSRLAQVRRAIEWMRRHFARPLRIEKLAAHVGMSESTFHRHFKAVTTISPLQYHKQIRLQEARRRLLAEPNDVTRVAFAVGYESASQFQFGMPPGRDAARMREDRSREDHSRENHSREDHAREDQSGEDSMVARMM
jgi:AraC-like DNA-binding protein